MQLSITHQSDPVLRSGVVLDIGYSPVTEILRRILPKETGVTLADSCGMDLLWKRDLTVPLLNGGILNPCSLPSRGERRITRQLKTLFSSQQDYSEGTGLSGTGYSSLKKTCTCIEGGNVKFFRHCGVEGAIIGVSSLIHSAHCMEVFDLFSEEITQKIESGDDVCGDVFDFVCNRIAGELGIQSKNLLVLQHMNLHVDLEVLLGSDGKVFLYDPSIADGVLESVKSTLSTKLMQMYRGYFAYEASFIDQYKKSKIFECNKRTLEEYGFVVIGVPGYSNFGGYRDGGQFLNGLFFADPITEKKILFSTSATSGACINSFCARGLNNPITHLFAESFSSVMREHGVSVVYVNCQEVRGGGLHCLTKELRQDWSVAPPQVIPIHSQFLPDYVVTQLKIKNFCKVKIECLVVTNSITKSVYRKDTIFSDCSECDVLVEVPFYGHVTFYLEGDQLRRFFYERQCIILPGHPQRLEIYE